jgi:hypothetical protein
MTDKYMTIVLKYEDEMPIKGFSEPVLGCEVVALAVGNMCGENFRLEEIIDGCDQCSVAINAT